MRVISTEHQSLHHTNAEDITSRFGGDFASEAFAHADNPNALPVIIPAYNRGLPDVPRLPWTLASLARASHYGGQPIRPLVVINGPDEGPIPDICNSFGLEPDSQVLKYDFSGKLRALKAGVDFLLRKEGYVGPFATTDDDAIVPPTWPATVIEHMKGTKAPAVSGGSISYYGVPGVSPIILAMRNRGNEFKERQAHKAGTVRAHGNNQWFRSDNEGVMLEAFDRLEPNIGFGDDVAIIETVKAFGGFILEMNLNPEGRVEVAGDRTKRFTDLVKTAFRHGDARYINDKMWSGTIPYTKSS